MNRQRTGVGRAAVCGSVSLRVTSVKVQVSQVSLRRGYTKMYVLVLGVIPKQLSWLYRRSGACACCGPLPASPTGSPPDRRLACVCAPRPPPRGRAILEKDNPEENTISSATSPASSTSSIVLTVSSCLPTASLLFLKPCHVFVSLPLTQCTNALHSAVESADAHRIVQCVGTYHEPRPQKSRAALAP